MKVACGVMYDTEGKILMGLRDSKGSNPGYWEFPGGKCEKGETLEECLHREWKEELNLCIEIEECIHTSKMDWIECYFYIGKIMNMEDMQINVHEHIGIYDMSDIQSLRLFEGDDEIIKILTQRANQKCVPKN
jgi:mutator protein MutT